MFLFLFLALSSIQLSSCLDLPSFIHSTTEGHHLCCFHVLANIDITGYTHLRAGFCVENFQLLLGKYQGAQLLEHVVRVCSAL